MNTIKMKMALCFCLHLGHWRLARLHSAFQMAWLQVGESGSLQACLEPDFWRKGNNFSSKEAKFLVATLHRQEEQSLLAANLLAKGIGLLAADNPNFPDSFSGSGTSFGPPFLFHLGNPKLIQSKMIAIVGPREASLHAKAAARQLSCLAVAKGFSTVNGYADGTDMAAVEAALRSGGQCVVFLPYGILLEGQRLKPFWKYLLSGDLLVLSSFHPLARFDSRNAMIRNRWVAMLASMVAAPAPLVDGGTKATLSMAAQLGKPTWLISVDHHELKPPHFPNNGMQFLRRDELDRELEQLTSKANPIVNSSSGANLQMEVV